MINASAGISDITTLEKLTINGVVTNNKDEKKAMFSSYIDLINENHAIPASNIKKTMVNLPEKIEMPKTA